MDWTVRERVQPPLGVMLKRIPCEYAYPPDAQEEASQRVLDQAQLLTLDWAT